ncbi:class I SAM-dependent methyltransferase [Humibacter ginsenosidimutans]|uniref:Class I SAM-dependent methyltransferase n=1 Tax=Humibacter ginsenosidimutans TaxID=2599293 RepID=A0A5B8M550_9MICO|nr:class I SAM-dependent methyltransferase [Humibacter ginsenosidimutans]QDZ15179.1 class I SAM-dependent methyltransferase [Humibacter ginsenosidimutans]
MSSEFVAANMRNWNERVSDHVVAYGAEAFADDPTALWAAKEAELLTPFVPEGSFDGLEMAHLQCHIGLDTISFARRGATIVGTDLSEEAIAAATALAERAGTATASFVRCANEDAPKVLGRQFDVVFTSVGVLAWLEDLGSWARTIQQLLRPGGVFLLYEGHPMMSAMEYQRDDNLLVVGEPYFATGRPMRFDDGTTYASQTILDNNVTYEWPHHLGEILTAILESGLRIEAFAEHRSMPWKALPSLVQGDNGWVLPEASAEIPLMFSVIARRP